MQFKVGDLAKKTGITVRTLHHYDELGLLSPSMRTESGHRLYTEADALRLQQIVSLRSLGFSLEHVAAFLKTPGQSPLTVLEMHLQILKEELEEKQSLIGDLEDLVGKLKTGRNPNVDELLKLIEDTTMIQKYYTEEQLERLAARAQAFGKDGMEQVQNDWSVLIEEVRVEMKKGTAPQSERMKELACRWRALVEMFTGGDPDIAKSLSTMYQTEGATKSSRGAVDEEVSNFIGAALANIGSS